MQAMIATSRTIGNDKFFQKAKELQYERHLKKVQQIMKLKKKQLKSNQQQTDKISGILKKAKEAAKIFQASQKNIMRKKQNKILLQKLWRISQGRVVQSSIPKVEQTQKIHHRQQYQKRMLEHIASQNRFLTKNILEQNRSKKSKSEIKEEIKQYLALRDSIRKKKLNEQNNSKSNLKTIRKSQSEAKKKSKYADLFTPNKQQQQNQKTKS